MYIPCLSQFVGRSQRNKEWGEGEFARTYANRSETHRRHVILPVLLRHRNPATSCSVCTYSCYILQTTSYPKSHSWQVLKITFMRLMTDSSSFPLYQLDFTENIQGLLTTKVCFWLTSPVHHRALQGSPLYLHTQAHVRWRVSCLSSVGHLLGNNLTGPGSVGIP